jgi:hypothetical protein
MRVWLYVRITIVLLGAIAGCVAPLGPAAKPTIDWHIVLIIFGFISIGLVFVLAIQAVNPRSARIWQRPSWIANPFDFKQPMQFFHMAAFATLAQGIGLLGHLLFARFPFYAEAALPLAMGAAILLGLRFTMLVFRSKMEQVT